MTSERKSFADLPIRVFTPLTPGDVCLALIGDGPILFKAQTPMAVRRAAQEWREQELAKAAARDAAAEKRKMGLASYRAAKRGGSEESDGGP